MNARLIRVSLLVALGTVLMCQAARPAEAALFWFHGVRSKTVSVCFVGTAVTTRLDRVQQVMTFLKQFEYAANVRFSNLGACPASVPQLNGNDYFDGDVRVLLLNVGIAWTTGPVPGQGCPATSNNSTGSWSNAPDDLAPNRPCLYNLRLGDDSANLRTGIANPTPWINHTLHEFGHALGLSHEHARVDENAGCVPSTIDEYHIASSGFITPYDKDSVMHYQFTVAQTPSCVQSGSNYSDQGLTHYDKLALHILYPEDALTAEYVGTTVVRVGATLSLHSAWEVRGANMIFVAHNFVWQIDGVTQSTTPDLNLVMNSPGAHTLSLTYSDFLGRNYSTSGTVRVLASSAYAQQIAGPLAATSPLSFYFLDSTYLPLLAK
jgi:hypothetical protein